MNLLTFASGAQLNEVAANIIISQVHTTPRSILGLATGGTPVGIYEEIVRKFQSGAVSFSDVSTFNLDEYANLSIDHPESYHTYMSKHLFSHVDLPAAQSHIPDGNAADLAAECVRYDAMIEQAGYIDLQILGLGHNGHIGFNEPAAELHAGTHVVELAQETRQANARFFASIDEVPTHALTMGVGSIMKAKKIMLVVKGADKADIVARALRGPVTTDCPASLLQLHPNLIVLLDQAAAGKLS